MTSYPYSCKITDGTLRVSSVPVLKELPDYWSIIEDATDTGAFLCVKSAEPASFLELPLGRLAGMVRFTSFHRFSLFWTKPANGTIEAEVQPET